jgi:hypothetical protein
MKLMKMLQFKPQSFNFKPEVILLSTSCSENTLVCFMFIFYYTLSKETIYCIP